MTRLISGGGPPSSCRDGPADATVNAQFLLRTTSESTAIRAGCLGLSGSSAAICGGRSGECSFQVFKAFAMRVGNFNEHSS